MACNSHKIGFNYPLFITIGDYKMSIFNTILEKLGFNAHAEPAPTIAASPVSSANAVVDVVAQLESRAAAQTEKLNWKVSIVDLLKLLGLESSLEARKALATELGCSSEKMCDSAQMNLWLHKTVLQKIAENGGNVPKELLG
jgi:hypothetical protein